MATWRPLSASRTAACSPAGPAPITSTSVVSATKQPSASRSPSAPVGEEVSATANLLRPSADGSRRGVPQGEHDREREPCPRPTPRSAHIDRRGHRPDAARLCVSTAVIDAEVFDATAGRRLTSRQAAREADGAGGDDPAGSVPVRLDEKTIRSAKDQEGNQRHLLAALHRRPGTPVRHAPVTASEGSPTSRMHPDLIA